MAAAQLVYRVEDRSILLPYYRRYACDPILRHLPRTLSPNTITHVGHLLNLCGTVLLLTLWPARGWPFVVAAFTLQAYNWCDNADGGHARRTGQCSAYGEFLDHGLDMLNTTYIAYLSAMGLGAPPLYWVLITLCIPGAACAAYWEQSNTGVFKLGLLNQIESITVVTIVLLFSAVFGTSVWERFAFHGVTLRHAILIWSIGTILFGMVRGMIRVARHPGGNLIPFLALVAYGVAVAAAAATGAITTVAAVALATGGTVYFGARSLVQRLRAQPPKLEPALALGAASLFGLVAWQLAGLAVNPFTGDVLAALACTGFGVQVLLETREGVQRLAEIDRAVPAQE